jgi:hypothetical protein
VASVRTMTSLTRGPLPAGVYWRRRAVLLGLGLVLVLLVGRLFGGDDGDPSGEGAATQVSGDPATSAPSDDAADRQPKKPRKSATPQEPVLAQPEGPCADSDILITPAVEQAIAGRPVAVTLELRTATSEACTWRVSSDHVAVKITSGTDRIWTSSECPRAIPAQDVVVRRDVTTFVEVLWKARRSEQGCPALTDWARAGTYHVLAAALGGEPAEARFALENPDPEVIQPPANPTQPKQNKPANPNRHEDQPRVGNQT